MAGRTGNSRRGQRVRGNGHSSRPTGSQSDVTRCICNGQQDDSHFMIQCDICKVWQHGECVNILDKKYCPDSYFCEQCRPEDHPYLIMNHQTAVKDKASPKSQSRPLSKPNIGGGTPSDCANGIQANTQSDTNTTTVIDNASELKVTTTATPASQLDEASRGLPTPADTTSQEHCLSPVEPSESRPSYESDSNLYSTNQTTSKKRKLHQAMDASRSTPPGEAVPSPQASPPRYDDEETESGPRKRTAKRTRKTPTRPRNSRTSTVDSQRGGDELSTESRNGSSGNSQKQRNPPNKHAASADVLFVCKVEYPSPTSSLDDMIERTDNILDYITRVQVEMAEQKQFIRDTPWAETTRANSPVHGLHSPAPTPIAEDSTSEPKDSTKTSLSTFTSTLSTMQMIDVLTRDLIRFQDTYNPSSGDD
ncbi:Histone deacetylase complex subunit [Dispira parvispora]|uniref:Histone deacetylase complex subunit n=1 Tax=Dispira parvispora TaxID=1520584 RepID=A0A9W8E1X0_9FUNG|nr:Histone deacetylase complex subunit [Dispira parvispora]